MIILDPIGAALLVVAPLGLLGVFTLALVDRLIPLLPSYGLFAGIGIAAAEGLWCLPTAMFAAVLESGTGAFGTFEIGSARRQHRRGMRLFRRRDRFGRFLRNVRRAAATQAFTAQLIPLTRTITPFIGGAIRRNRTRFLIATGAGLTLWNATSIGLGYIIVQIGGPKNATVVAVVSFTLLIAISLGSSFIRPSRSRDVILRRAAVPCLPAPIATPAHQAYANPETVS